MPKDANPKQVIVTLCWYLGAQQKIPWPSQGRKAWNVTCSHQNLNTEHSVIWMEGKESTSRHAFLNNSFKTIPSIFKWTTSLTAEIQQSLEWEFLSPWQHYIARSIHAHSLLFTLPLQHACSSSCALYLHWINKVPDGVQVNVLSNSVLQSNSFIF